MENEIDALNPSNTWIFISLLVGMSPIIYKWVFRVTFFADGASNKYKVRIVAYEFLQEFGVDYFESFSSIVKTTTIRIVLTLALSSG